MNLEHLCELLGVERRAVKQWLYPRTKDTPLWIKGSLTKGFEYGDIFEFLHRNPEYADKILATFADDEARLVFTAKQLVNDLRPPLPEFAPAQASAWDGYFQTQGQPT
jgi:hypothetical protein